MDENDITYEIIGAAYRIHKHFGPGLLESAYKECLCYLLKNDGFIVEREKSLPLTFEGITIRSGYRADICVNGKIIIEAKTVEAFNDLHIAQLITYLKLSGCKVGLLLNFKVADMKKGIKRIIL